MTRVKAAAAIGALAAAGVAAVALLGGSSSSPTQTQTLIDQAVATLKQTTVGYAGHTQAWQQNPSTKWFQGLDLLAQARAAAASPATTTTPTTTTSPAPASCFPDPPACGYPGPGVGDGIPPGTVLKTGVPPGTTLDPSGQQINANTAGVVIDSYQLTKKLQINANGVRYQHSLSSIAGVAGQTGVEAINIAAGVTGVVIDGVECKSSNGVPIEACLATSAGSQWAASSVWFHDCPDCIETYGRGTLTGSYVTTDKLQPGDHVEPIYTSTPGASVDVRHSTLLNPQQQTAVIFVDDFGGGFARASVTDSLVGGGGWSFYSHVDLANVRMGRCLTAAVKNPTSGGSDCQQGPDSHGYWPYGGYFGATICPLQSETWTAVRWDDNLAAVTCPSGLRLLPGPALLDGRPRGAPPL